MTKLVGRFDMDEICVIIPYFNPSKYLALFRNYQICTSDLKNNKVEYLTIELSFDGEYDIPTSEPVIQLRSDSIMWQKERLINFGVSQLPSQYTKFAWVDCDVLFESPDWLEQAKKKLDEVDIIQLFKRVFYLPNGDKSYQGRHQIMVQGVIWQNRTHRNWLERRREKLLPFSSPGFAWAANRASFENGLYDKNIIGSGDTFIVDSILGSWNIHGFASKFTDAMKADMAIWLSGQKSLTYDYIPQSIYHLHHGSLKNRQYMDRHNLVLDNDFDPSLDIEIKNNVFEWASDKPNLHSGIINYFNERNEDEN